MRGSQSQAAKLTLDNGEPETRGDTEYRKAMRENNLEHKDTKPWLCPSTSLPGKEQIQ